MSNRMSPVGSIMWGVGQDATLRMTVGNLVVLDRAPSSVGVGGTIACRRGTRSCGCASIRAAGSVMGSARSGSTTRPSMPQDHMRSVAVASPGDQRQVLDLVALLEQIPFDPSMSPWDITVIEGLAGGRAALYLRAHHCLVDGSQGVSIVRSMLDDSVATRRGA